MHASQTASRFNVHGTHSSDVKPGVSKFEKWVIIFLLLLFSQALLGRVFASEDNPEGSILLRAMWLPVYGYTLIMLGLRWRQLMSISGRLPFLVILSGLAMLSALWSFDPATSFRRGIAVICTTGFGFYLAASLSWRDMLRYLGIAWFILAIGNFIAGALVPGFGVMHEIHVGAWRGLFSEKNAMGGHFARAAFLMAFMMVVDREWRKFWIGAFLLSVALVLLSTSKTSLLGLMLGGAVLIAWLWMRGNRFLTLVSLWLIFALTFIGVIILLTMPETVASLIGRDLTLTGRTNIWTVLLRVMEERPLFGFGYGTFWALDSEPAQLVRAETQWEVPTAHNGLLELMLALGRVGALLFILDFVINLGRSLFTIHRRKTSVLAFGYFTLLALFSISESLILNQNSIIWVMYCAFAGRLALDMKSAKPVPSPMRGREVQLKRHVQLRGRQSTAR
jgi:exopolysaccharide production protein ExoQ